MIWDEFLRHFRFCDEEDSGLSDGAERTKKSPKAHTKTDTSSQEKLFGEIQNSFLYFAWYEIVYSGRQTLPLQVNWQDAEFMKN